MDHAFAACSGHECIDLGNNRIRLVHDGLDDIHHDPEAHVSVFVRRAELNQDGVNLDISFAEKLDHAARAQGHMVCITLGKGTCHTWRDEKRLYAEPGSERPSVIGIGAQRNGRK